jgi:hypothetical protein
MRLETYIQNWCRLLVCQEARILNTKPDNQQTPLQVTFHSTAIFKKNTMRFGTTTDEKN